MAKYWNSHVPQYDDFGDLIKDIIIDGRTTQGPWALMTPKSWEKHTFQRFGVGYAQKYEKQSDGKWLKTEG
ncbi:MAG: hypothetical protein IM561_09110 [Microcystis sp. M60BS1]|uniref:hypothetical protein n=1 Tax=unclassified Microcystis TaxID=2643300 RepID=UPI00257C0FBB|nr:MULTISPECIES: hypothetical protein [unclassified Microcystis]MCA2510528.1 hypothetical protein [Microcystis sp. M60BS1]MCA2555762.1 hypothetical protein [Microcystis sp. M43BS1]MCA2638408.1 hypothetical protein [Microcystis sp. M18BS1]MCA6581474.1 hypothetical protein [Pseudanabaena sp. M34BS1SP1A06MG]